LIVNDAALSVPAGSQTPIAAEIGFSSPAADGPLTCSLDWRRSGSEEWSIEVRTADGHQVALFDGGARLALDGVEQPVTGAGEYPNMYRRFAQLIDERRSDVDVRPLRLVADCLLIGSRESVAAVVS
jgi:hypothetical protein